MVVKLKNTSAQTIRLWEVEKDTLKEIEKTILDLEERLEKWLESDISIISPYLLVIGRQVETEFGGIIDLLCLNEKGDTIIVELKREKTPREIVAQVLDYASWVKELSGERIINIANDYLKKSGPIEEVFEKHFHMKFPDSINENHEMLIVASEVDSRSQRIVSYLTENYGVGINIAAFNFFKKGDKEYLARTFYIEPSRVDSQQRRRLTSKRLPNLTYEELQNIADEKGIGEIYEYLTSELSQFFEWTGTTRSSFALGGTQEDRQITIFSLVPKDSDESLGLKWQVYFSRFMRYFQLSKEKALSIFPVEKEEWELSRTATEEYRGYMGHISFNEAKEFVSKIKSIRSLDMIDEY